MENKENKVLLTPELFSQISSDKTNKIVSLKALREDLKQDISTTTEELERLYQLKEQLESKIRITSANLSRLRGERFKTSREIGKQKRLSSKITRLATKDNEVYVDVDKFYPEAKPKKR